MEDSTKEFPSAPVGYQGSIYPGTFKPEEDAAVEADVEAVVEEESPSLAPSEDVEEDAPPAAVKRGRPPKGLK